MKVFKRKKLKKTKTKDKAGESSSEPNPKRKGLFGKSKRKKQEVGIKTTDIRLTSSSRVTQERPSIDQILATSSSFASTEDDTTIETHMTPVMEQRHSPIRPSPVSNSTYPIPAAIHQSSRVNGLVTEYEKKTLDVDFLSQPSLGRSTPRSSNVNLKKMSKAKQEELVVEKPVLLSSKTKTASVTTNIAKSVATSDATSPTESTPMESSGVIQKKRKFKMKKFFKKMTSASLSGGSSKREPIEMAQKIKKIIKKVPLAMARFNITRIIKMKNAHKRRQEKSKPPMFSETAVPKPTPLSQRNEEHFEKFVKWQEQGRQMRYHTRAW